MWHDSEVAAIAYAIQQILAERARSPEQLQLALTDAQEAVTPSVHEQRSDKAGAQLMAGEVP
jgi:ribonucleoside-diphosphate reductase alpha chain